MDPDSTMLCLILMFAYLLFRIVLSLGETLALYGSEARLERIADEGDERAKILLRFLNDPSRFLATIQSGSVLIGTLCVVEMVETFTQPLTQLLNVLPLGEKGLHLCAILLLALLFSAISLIFGTMVPKKLTQQKLDNVTLTAAPVLNLLYKLSRPLAVVLSAVSHLILICMRIDPHAKVEQVTEEEILMMVDTGSEEGTIEETEKEMITNIFEFDEKTVAEVMTHRTEMCAVDTETTIVEAIELVIREGFSRIPVFDDSIDNIVGVLFAKDLLGVISKPEEHGNSIKSLTREVLFVPESKRCTELFEQFKSSKNQIAVVVDEYGGTYGIVTMEDLLEAIVGNMQDEYDNEEEDVVVLSESEYILSGALTLEDVEKALDRDLSDVEEHDTLGGYVTDLLGRIPGENEHPVVEVDNLKLTVLQVKERRIMKVKAELLPVEDEDEE